MAVSLRVLAVVAVSVLACAGCTDEPEPTASTAPETPAASAPTASASATSAPTASAPASVASAGPRAADLKAPPKMPGELARQTFVRTSELQDNKTRIGGSPRTGQTYHVHAACNATVPGRTLTFQVLSATEKDADTVLASGDVDCDGEVSVNGVGELRRGPVAVKLTGQTEETTSGYAVLTSTAEVRPS